MKIILLLLIFDVLWMLKVELNEGVIVVEVNFNMSIEGVDLVVGEW